MVAEGDIFPPNRGTAEVITDYLTYLRLAERAAGTRTHYRRRLEALDRWLAEHHGAALLTATAEQLHDYRAELTVLPTSVTTYMRAVRSFYRWVERAGIRSDDPTWNIPIPRRRRGLPRPIADDDLWFAVDQAPHRIRPWLALAGGAGARACEIAVLERMDILNTARNPLLRLTGKGGKSRMVPLTPWVWGELQSYGLPKRGIVFKRHDGRRGPNTAATISHLASEFFDSIGVDATIHMCRHRYATVALEACGGDLRVVQELLGHASPSTTAVYTAFSDAKAIRAALGTQPPKLRPVRAVNEDETQPMPIEDQD